ncbi:caspase, EACC1-associated type [Paractinoplanes globisporus]|uniref:Caspase family protein n=1 Tax=Paractinoplanes globisporus TaxID=113565 RepID=A0ABW6WM83_9ACTN|nr:caspase family protein [Actinoplanes globisporus]
MLLGCGSYADASLPRLRSPGLDVEELARVLRDAGYDQVAAEIDGTARQGQLAVEAFLAGASVDDALNIVYLSCHGVLDQRGKLHFAFADTEQQYLRATAVAAEWVRDRIYDSRSRATVVLVDCCFSGGFITGMQARSGSEAVEELVRGLPEGSGVAVLTASGQRDASFEDASSAVVRPSYFTDALVTGIGTGAADLDRDGRITIDELYEYVYHHVVSGPSPQRPRRFDMGEGTLVVTETAMTPEAGVAVAVPTPITPPRPAPAAVPPAPAWPRSMTRAGPTARPAPPATVDTASSPRAGVSAVAGNVVGWGGRNTSFTLALTSAVDFGRLAVPAGLRDITVISAGDRHGLALAVDGHVVAWGDNAFGQARVPRRLGRVRTIAAGGAHNLAVRSDGSVTGWGNNHSGQVRAPKSLGNAVGVAAGGWHSLALLSDGTVAAWGENGDGQARVPPGLRGVVEISAGDAHSVALHADGTVSAWGRNDHGQSTVLAEAVGVSAVAAGTAYTVAVRTDGTLLSWGHAPAGSPRRLPGGAAQVAAGESHCLALGVDGTVRAWGDNTYEQCVVPDGLGRFLMIAAGRLFNIALIAPDG